MAAWESRLPIPGDSVRARPERGAWVVLCNRYADHFPGGLTSALSILVKSNRLASGTGAGGQSRGNRRWRRQARLQHQRGARPGTVPAPPGGGIGTATATEAAL
jgi:hypothetical protein